jgi:hypothetical protein
LHIFLLDAAAATTAGALLLLLLLLLQMMGSIGIARCVRDGIG